MEVLTECFEQSLRGHSSRTLEDSSAESNVDGGGLVPEVSDEGQRLAAALEVIHVGF